MAIVKYWETAKHQRIRLADLTNEHLVNIVKMMESKALVEKFKAKYELTNRPKPVNKAAVKLLESEIKRVNKFNASNLYPIYKDLLKEKTKRKM